MDGPDDSPSIAPARLRPWRRALVALVLPVALAGCGLVKGDGPIPVASIGDLHRDPDRAPPPMTISDRLLLDATAGGLVGFAADGQIEAGLAERWTVIDDGRSYIFRLRDADWAGGGRVRAADVALLLARRMGSPRLRSALRGEFSDVIDVRARTDRVIEISLRRPKADLLDLLAQPDMAIFGNGRGWGPWRPSWTGGTAMLSPLPVPGSEEDLENNGQPLPPAVQFWGTSALSAVTQFDADVARVVMGGHFENWPYVNAAGIGRDSVIVDPVDGLFGLAVVEDTGLLETSLGRNAVGMAINRPAIADALNAPGWRARITVRPSSDDARALAPIYPAWADFSPRERRAHATAIVSAWRRQHGDAPVRLRIALPAGPGARILFARIHGDLAAVGIDSAKVPIDADADLRLIDELAPSDDPAWYLRPLGCNRGISCDPQTTAALAAINDAPDRAARLAAISRAEQIVMAHSGFFALAAPMRWSLAAPQTPGMRSNMRGRHSLIRLRATPN